MKKDSFLQQSFYNVIYKSLNALFPLISTSIISRILLAEGVGKVASAQNIVTYFTFLAPLGLNFYGTREIAKKKESDAGNLFAECFIINSVSTLVCVVLYYVLVLSNSHFYLERNLYIVAGLAIVLNFFNVDWFYQGMGEFRYIAIRAFLVKVLFLIGIVVFVNSKNDYVRYEFLYCLAIAGNNILNILHLRKYRLKVEFDKLQYKKHFLPLLVLLASSVAVELYSLVDTTMLSAMCKAENVGYYSNSMKVVKVAILLVASIGGTTLPKISPLIENSQILEVEKVVTKIIRIMIYIAVPCGVGMMSVSNDLVYVLFGMDFLEAASTIKILSFLFFVLVFSHFFETQILVALKKEKKIFWATASGAISNIILNIFLIPRFQQKGAAVASVISETIVAVIMYLQVIKDVHIRIERVYVLKIVASAILMGGVVLYICSIEMSVLIRLLISLLGGSIIYFGSNYLMKNSFGQQLRNME